MKSGHFSTVSIKKNQDKNMFKIRNSKKCELKQLSKLLDSCFPLDKKMGGMFKRWPHCYLDEQPENHFIIKHSDRIVSHIGCIPQALVIGGKEISIAGISGVATDLKYRGHGYMKLLMQQCIKKMQENNVGFSYLGGNRQRYNHFGFENAGREWVFEITHRSLDGVSNYYQDKKVRYKIRIYNSDEKDLNEILKIYNSNEFYIKRSIELTRIVYNRKGSKIVIASIRGEICAYMVISDQGAIGSAKNSREVTEFGNSRNEHNVAFVEILDYIFKKQSIDNLSLFSAYRHPFNGLFFSLSSSCRLITRWMIKIINLREIFTKFLRQIKEKYKKSDIKINKAITFCIKNTNQQVTLNFSEYDVNIHSSGQDIKFCMEEKDMVRLIFGISQPSVFFKLGNHVKLLDSIFPLDFYIWHNNGI